MTQRKTSGGTSFCNACSHKSKYEYKKVYPTQSAIPEYRAAGWNQCREEQINAVYQVKTIAAPFTHHTKDCNLKSLSHRRTIEILCALFKA